MAAGPKTEGLLRICLFRIERGPQDQSGFPALSVLQASDRGKQALRIRAEAELAVCGVLWVYL